MLAVMARVDLDTANRSKYLKAAKTAYSYAKSHKGVTNSGEFYDPNWWDGRWEEGPFLAALELYRATKDETYKNDAKDWYEKLDLQTGGGARFGYSNAVPLAVVMAYGVFGWDLPQSSIDTQRFIDRLYEEQAEGDIFKIETGGAGSFSVRSPAGGAFLYALYSKFDGTTSYDKMIEKNVAYLLGDNSNKKSYVVGFSKNGANAPKRPHHRGYYGNEDPGREVAGMGDAPEKNKLLGGMIAGNFNDGNHSNDVSDWRTNEVCVDLNAPMVGALGYILSKKAPKTNEDLGIVLPDVDKKDTVKKDTTKKDSSEQSIALLNLSAKKFTLTNSGSVVRVSHSLNMPFKVQLFDLTGKLLQEVKSEGKNLEFKIQGKGVFRVRVVSAKSSEIFTVKSY
jgi:hypothetical protein